MAKVLCFLQDSSVAWPLVSEQLLHCNVTLEGLAMQQLIPLVDPHPKLTQSYRHPVLFQGLQNSLQGLDGQQLILLISVLHGLLQGLQYSLLGSQIVTEWGP